MSEFTPRFALPYPAETDTPDVPKDVKALAEALDKVINPPGTLRLTAAETPEAGWLACEGQAVSRTTYAALFAAIGTAYGEGDKLATFNLPDYRERTPMGAGNGSGGSGGGVAVRGAKGGEWKHTLTISELPPHQHKINGATGAGSSEGNSAIPPNNGLAGAQNVTFNEGGGTGHNNVQPYTVCNVWIKT